MAIFAYVIWACLLDDWGPPFEYGVVAKTGKRSQGNVAAAECKT